MMATTLTAPAHWAPYLINGDKSGMSTDDMAAIASHIPASWEVVGCSDEGRFTWSYRLHGGDAEGGTVLNYDVLVRRADA